MFICKVLNKILHRAAFNMRLLKDAHFTNASLSAGVAH